MNKIVVLMLFFLISTISAFSADMRFVQVDGVFFNANDKTSVSKLQKMVDDINKQKDVEFVIFSGWYIFVIFCTLNYNCLIENVHLRVVWLKLERKEFRFPLFIIYPFILYLERDRKKKKLVGSTN